MKTEMYKGHAVLILDNPSGPPVKMGVNKAKTILTQIDTMRRFVAEFDRPKEKPAKVNPDDMAKQIAALQEQIAKLSATKENGRTVVTSGNGKERYQSV